MEICKSGHEGQSISFVLICSYHECRDVLPSHESTMWRDSTGNTTATSWKGLGVACDLSRAIKLEGVRE